MKVKRINPAALIVLCSFILSSCNSSGAVANRPGDVPKEIADGGFLSADPCGPPCFWTLVPGITTTEETMVMLDAMNIADECSPYDNSEEAGTRGLICSPVVELSISFRLDEDIVNGVGFHPSQTVTVEEIIERYGEPDAISVEYSGLPHDSYNTVMMLYYDDIYTRLLLPEQESDVFELRPSVEVQTVVYFDRATYAETRQRHSTDWNGYGKYSPHP